MAEELVGCEVPRIWTPPLRPLTRQTSLGFELADFAEFIGVRLVPWQRWLFVHGLELQPDYVAADPDPLFRFDTVVVIVSRQNGKTEAIKIKKLWRMFMDGARDTLATAQDLGNAEKTWRQAVELVEGNPELAAMIANVNLRNGHKSLQLRNLAQYLVRASNSSPRGWSIDDLDLDELMKHHTWEAWAAAAPTTLARPRSQIWGWSSAGDARSTVLWHLRASAMRGANGVDPDELQWFSDAVNQGGVPAEVDGEDVEFGDSLALFEWSAHPSAALHDRQGRAQANPSLGHGFLTERKLAGLIRSTPSTWVARQEFMCQWRPTASGGPFPDGHWAQGIDADSQIAPDVPVFACVEVSHDRSNAYVLVAGARADGHVHVEVATRRAGTDWVAPWFREREGRFAAVTLQAKGAPSSSLAEPLAEAGVKVAEWGGADLARACGLLWDLVHVDEDQPSKRRLYHLPQPVLDVPASTAVTRPLGDAWVIDRRRSEVDAAPLMGAAGAVWLASQYKPKAKPGRLDWL